MGVDGFMRVGVNRESSNAYALHIQLKTLHRNCLDWNQVNLLVITGVLDKGNKITDFNCVRSNKSQEIFLIRKAISGNRIY